MKSLFSFIFLVLTLGFCATAFGQNKPVRQVTILLDGQAPQSLVEGLKSEISELAKSEFEIKFQLVEGDRTAARARQDLETALADPATSVVIAAGILTSAVTAERKAFAKPTIAMAVVDQELQGFSVKKGTSGVRDFTFYTLPYGFMDGVDDFRRYGDFKKLALLVNHEIVSASPNLVAGLQKVLAKDGVELVLVPMDADYKKTLAGIPADADAVYVGSLRGYSDEEFASLMNGVHERRLKTYAHAGGVDVKRGALMGSAPEANLKSLARRVALATLGALNKERLDKMPLGFLTATPRLVLNTRVARQVGFSPGWVLLADAELIGADADETETLSLAAAIEEALAQNPELVAQVQQVQAAGFEVDRAWTGYKPLLDIFVAGQATSGDVASISLGVSQFQAVAGARFEQTIFDVDASAGIDINEPLQQSRVFALEGRQLDVFREASGAYIAVLQAKTASRVARDNLNLTRGNLQLAKARVSIGVSDPSDVYRWETEIARAQETVVRASANVDAARAVLQQVLGRTGALDVRVAEIERGSMLGDLMERMPEFFGDPASVLLFEEFLVGEAYVNTPELDQIDEEVKSQERVRSRSSRAWFLPTAGIAADMHYFLVRAGEGSETEIPALGATVPDFFWSAEAFIRLPIFERGTRVVDEDQANASIIALQNEKRAIETRLQRRIRLALTDLRVSFSNIEITKRGFEFAAKNLELVTANYMRGTVNVIVLTDAQNSAFVAEQASADAHYQYLVDIVELFRALGRVTVAEAKNQGGLLERFLTFQEEKSRQVGGGDSQ